MGTVDLWLGPAGAGKTRQALDELRHLLYTDWAGVRFLVPTVGHKISIEHLLLTPGADRRQGLFGDPVSTFFDFAEEVARRARLHGRRLSELQKHLLLKQLVRETPLDYFDRAAYFPLASSSHGPRRVRPGFVHALGDIIDELKVHMVFPQELLTTAESCRAQAPEFSQKLRELGLLYEQYQHRIWQEDLFDNEGIMWIAAERLRAEPQLLSELRCLILDGFARLTPVQADFLRALAPRVERIILLFDYEEARASAYAPVQVSLQRLEQFATEDRLALTRTTFTVSGKTTGALAALRARLYRPDAKPCAWDSSVRVLAGATPAHEMELLAREVRALLRQSTWADGTPVSPAQIAILARNADAVRERLARTFARYRLPLRQEPPLLAHTAVGRALLATFRLVRDHWQREDLFTLLKSGMLPIAPAQAFALDVLARTHYLRQGQETWLTCATDETLQQAIAVALRPLQAFDTAYRAGGDATGLMQAISTLLASFRAQALPPTPPLPDVDPEGARRYLTLDTAFARCEQLLAELQGLGSLLGHSRREEVLDEVTTALLREHAPEGMPPEDGIALLSAHATGGEKFKAVFLCHMQEGAFPHHQRESAFLMDHEREAEVLQDAAVHIEARKHLEEDERYWFLHALSTATERLTLCYALHDADGSPLERSSFLDETAQVLYGLKPLLKHPHRTSADLQTKDPEEREAARALENGLFHRTSFRDIVPALSAAESDDEFLAALAHGLVTDRAADRQQRLAAAYAQCPQAQGPDSRLAALFRRARTPSPLLQDTLVSLHLRQRSRPFSASELQRYQDCPFLWFASACLGLEPVPEVFSPLDRGEIIHRVLRYIFVTHQPHRGEPVHLEQLHLPALIMEAEAYLATLLEANPRFQHRATFMREIEAASLRRLLRRFLVDEIARATTRQTHPAYFEYTLPEGAHLRGGGVGIPLTGQIDRIDLVDDDPRRAVILDYKFSAAQITQRALRAGEILQAPVYALALEQNGFGATPIGVEFLGLKQGDSTGIYQAGVSELYGDAAGMAELPDAEWRDYLDRAAAQITALADGIYAGEIPLQPTTGRCPDRCPYWGLCRGDRFMLARLARTAGVSG